MKLPSPFLPLLVLRFAVQPSGGGPSPDDPRHSRSSGQRRLPGADGPAWKPVVQYIIASAFCLVFLGLLVLDPFLPEYDVPLQAYMITLVVIVFALPGSERIATTLINAVFRRKDDDP